MHKICFALYHSEMLNVNILQHSPNEKHKVYLFIEILTRSIHLFIAITLLKEVKLYKIQLQKDYLKINI